MSYPWYRVFASAACIVVALGLYFVVNRTRLGMMIRAGASNRDMARGLGLDIRPALPHRVRRRRRAGRARRHDRRTPLSSVYPGMGSSVLIICFVVVVIGGIGSITGALIASLLVGFVDTFGKVFFAEYSGIGVYLLMAVVLVWRPEALMKPSVLRRAEAAGLDRSRGGRRRGAGIPLCAARGELTPYTQELVAKIAIYALLALSLELLVGVTGLVSHQGMRPSWASARTSTVLASRGRQRRFDPRRAAAALATMRHYGAVRRRAVAAHQGVCTSSWSRSRSRRWPTSSSTTRKDRRWQRRHLPERQADARRAGNSTAATSCTSTSRRAGRADRHPRCWPLALLRRSRFGHALAGIRVNEQRMRAAGFATVRYKLAAFVVAGALAGVAGVLYAVKDGFVNPELLAWQESGSVLLMMILGGIGQPARRGRRRGRVLAAEGDRTSDAGAARQLRSPRPLAARRSASRSSPSSRCCRAG